jgi:glutamine kinase
MDKYNVSKCQILKYLDSRVTKFRIPNFLFFNVFSYEENSSNYVSSIVEEFNGHTIVIRSSAADEDGKVSSSAGEYDSVLNIPSDEPEKISNAINVVISSYKKKRSLLPEDEVMAQKMVEKTTMSGVIFTHDLNTGAPYYVVNYDDQSGLTNTVTSGEGEYSNRTLYIHRSSIDKLRSERFKKLLFAVQELEEVMESKFLDIEFALGESLTPYLLQVRFITTQTSWNNTIVKHVDSTLRGVQLFIAERFKKLNGIYGDTTIFGQMPDWNPIEMIGRAPRALAISIYKSIITDHAWSSARAIMGYSVPNGQPLMVSLAGQPFIDTRLSLHSYIPNTVKPAISNKVVNAWNNNLMNSPELHDKIEFEVAITCYSFDFDERIERFIGNALTNSEKNEFKQAHLQHTMNLIKGKESGSIDKALDKINALYSKQNNASNSHSILSLFTMVDDCIKLGTIPFSILARHGFIAKTILLSLERQGIITKDEVDQIQGSVRTVASDLVDDMNYFQKGTLSNADFMARYGHLRPGTYDILSPRYDQIDDFHGGSSHLQKNHKSEFFNLSKQQQEQINTLLSRDGFSDFSSDDLLNYVRNAIVGREYGKFVFTRSVSDMLELIAKFAEENGLSRNEISHVPINAVFNMLKTSCKNSINERLMGISKQESKKHEISVAIRLPQVLIDQFGVYIVPFQVSHPNFITSKKVTAPCLALCSQTDYLSLSGKVIIIEGADPGFDWIFSQKISGLITKYGGANSHMAIRCAEFGIPAAIGCGEQYFDLLLKSKRVHLDCAAGLINPLH